MWINYTTFIESFNFHAKTLYTVNIILDCSIDIGWWLRFRHFCITICNETVSSLCNRKSLKACVKNCHTFWNTYNKVKFIFFYLKKEKTAKIVSFIKLDRIQPFKLLKTRYKLKTRTHVEAFIGVKIVSISKPVQVTNVCHRASCTLLLTAIFSWLN